MDGRSEAEIFAALGRDAGPQQGALYTAICNAEQGESDASRETDTASTHPLRNQSGYLIPANEGSYPVSRDPNLPAEKIESGKETRPDTYALSKPGLDSVDGVAGVLSKNLE